MGFFGKGACMDVRLGEDAPVIVLVEALTEVERGLVKDWMREARSPAPTGTRRRRAPWYFSM